LEHDGQMRFRGTSGEYHTFPHGPRHRQLPGLGGYMIDIWAFLGLVE
jgi:hypothetical protein